MGGYDLFPCFIRQGVPVQLAECQGFAMPEHRFGDAPSGGRGAVVAQDIAKCAGVVVGSRADHEYVAIIEGDESRLYWQQVSDRLPRRLERDAELVSCHVRFGGGLERRVEQHTAVLVTLTQPRVHYRRSLDLLLDFQ